MKKILPILLMGALFVGSCFNTKAQTQVTQPFALLDSTMFSTKPYFNKPAYYTSIDSLAKAKGWSYTNYYNDAANDTVRFARQRQLFIQVTNSQSLGSIQLIIHKDSTGTINAAKGYLEGSDDGVNWINLPDTLTCTNVSINSKIWVLPCSIYSTTTGASSYIANRSWEFLPYLYYGVKFVGVATSKADIHAFFVPRHRSTSPN